MYFSSIIIHGKYGFPDVNGCDRLKQMLSSLLFLLLLAGFPLFWLALLTEEMECTLD